jgi:hypothetical protein
MALRNETKKTTIDGYEVELVLYAEGGEQRSDCFIAKRVRGGRTYTASLACLSDIGELDAHDGYVHAVHAQTITAIEQWAEQEGY